MTIPKKRKPLANKKRIQNAIKIAGGTSPQEDKPKPKKTARPKSTPTKKVGRPEIAGKRSGRITFYLAQETLQRFDIGFLQEKIKQAKKGKKIDKSLVLGNLLKDWLDKKGY